MADRVREFYESYWSKPQAVPMDDSTINERQNLLLQTLTNFRSQQYPSSMPLKILDAGCGNGMFSHFMASHGFRVSGIDISRAAIERAKGQWPEGEFEQGSLEKRLPFLTGEFDAVWNTEVLEHLFDIHACLSEFNRVLKPQGLVIITVPYHGFIKNLAIALAGFEKHYNPYSSHIRFFTKRSLGDSLALAGFQLIYWKGIGRCWPLYKSVFLIAMKIHQPSPAPEIIG